MSKTPEDEGVSMDAKELGQEPAYPAEAGHYHSGLTKREAFALAAPQEDIADALPDGLSEYARLLGVSRDEYSKDVAGNYFRVIALIRFKWADAMLAELAKGGA